MTDDGPESGGPAAQEPSPLSAGAMVLIVAAAVGGGLTLTVPMAFTLAWQVERLAPGRESLLGLVVGAGAAVSILAAPITGMLSDRARTRWGRRRPFTVGGIIVGLASLPLLVLAPNLPVLAAGWMVASLGFGTSQASIGNFQADRLPRAQRGRVSGLTTLAMQVSPVLGILLAGAVAPDHVWVVLAPALIGTALLLLFALLIDEPDTRGARIAAPLTPLGVLRDFVFDPREHPEFAWNWLGRCCCFLGLSLTSSFGALFYADRLSTGLADIASVLALSSTAAVVAASIGSVVGGTLSDRVGRRPLIALASALIASGCTTSAFAWSLAPLLLGTFISSLGIAVLMSANHAMTLDVLPNRTTEAGRFMAIARFSQKLPAAAGPLLAPVILGIEGADGFTALYLTSGAFALLGGAILALRVRSA